MVATVQPGDISIARGDNGGALLSGGKDALAKLWTVSTAGKAGFTCVAELAGAKDAVECGASHARSSVVCTGGWDGNIQVHDLGESFNQAIEEHKQSSTKKRRKPLQWSAVQSLQGGSDQCVAGMCWAHNDVSKVFTASWDHHVTLWNIGAGTSISQVGIGRAVFCVDGRPGHPDEVVFGGSGKGIFVWDSRT